MVGQIGIIGKAAEAFRGVVNNVAEAFVAAAATTDTIYLQQVPSDRWYYNYKTDFKTTKEELQARGWAIFYTLEGAVRTVVEAVRLLFAKYVSNTREGVDKLETILHVQFQSLKYTAWAIIDPVGQKRNTEQELRLGNFLVGCSKEAFRWGDRYEGTLTIPVSFNYNWHPTT